MPPFVRRCSQCSRPDFFFGSWEHNPWTGRYGWCRVCSWHWRYKEAVLYSGWYRCMIDKHTHLRGRGELLRIVGAFLVEARSLDDLRTGQAQAQLRHTQELAVLFRWKRILVFGGLEAPLIRDRQAGRIRSFDTKDDSGGILLPHLEFIRHLDYVNRSWKLYVSIGPHRPLNIVCSFLGFSRLP